MISNIVVTGAAGSYQVTFDSTSLSPSRVYVQVGSSAGAYTETDNGDVNGAAVNGIQPCIAFLATTLASFHFTCATVAADGTVDASADQAYGIPVAVGGGDDDGHDGHGHGDDGHGGGDGHGKGGDGRGRGWDGDRG